MDVSDALLLMVLAMLDLVLIVHLRQRRRRLSRNRHLLRLLQLYIRRDLAPTPDGEQPQENLIQAS